MIISVSTIGILVIALVYVYFKSVYSYWKKRNVIGPKPIPLFGNVIESALRHKHVAVVFEKIYNDFPNEKYVGFYRMTTPSLLIRDLDMIKQILIRDFDAFPDRGVDYSKEGLGDNLFHCDPITWKALRNHITPIYTTGKIKKTLNLLKKQNVKFVDYVNSVCQYQQEQEMIQLFRKYTIASIMVSSFGMEVDTFSDNTELFDQIDRSMIVVPYVNELELLFPGILKKANISLFNKTAIRFCYELVETVKRYRNDKPPTSNRHHNDVMDVLLALAKDGEIKSLQTPDKENDASFKITDQVMAGQVFIFFAAGYVNNTNVLSYAMYHLAKNPEIQDKLTAEIDEILERFNGEFTFECFNEMTYLDQVFSETLRMHSTANSIQRRADRDYMFAGTDLRIEKNMSVVISAKAIHYDPKFYPNPHQFDPDRFLPENVKSRHSCAYLPFGIGPRSCIASRFAKMQFNVCVAGFLSKYRVEPSRRTKDDYFINPHRSILSPTGGIHLNIIPRSL